MEVNKVNNPKVDIVQLMMADIEEYTKKLRVFLIDNDINAYTLPLGGLISSITKLKTKLKSKDYVSFLYDDNGYIIRVNVMDDFVETSLVPDDVTQGYYKFENNKFVLDEERQRQIEEV